LGLVSMSGESSSLFANAANDGSLPTVGNFKTPPPGSASAD
jgi:hypothetical protein